MDKGLIGLIVLSVLVALSAFLKYVGVVSADVVWGIIQLGLVYHIGYTLHSMVLYKCRIKRRNVRRGNTRPPRSNRYNW